MGVQANHILGSGMRPNLTVASLESELRNACLDQGVHPVWHEMAKRSNLFGQFSACPVVESKATSSKNKLDLSEITIDPFDVSSCLDVLKSIPDD